MLVPAKLTFGSAHVMSELGCLERDPPLRGSLFPGITDALCDKFMDFIQSDSLGHFLVAAFPFYAKAVTATRKNYGFTERYLFFW